jgi:hypothetical protein
MPLDPDTIASLKTIQTALTVPFYTTLGAFTLYILNRLHGKQPFSLFRALNVDVHVSSARARTIFADMILSSALGAFVVIPLTSPSTIPQAIIAGLGMTGVLAAHTKGSK